MKKRGFRGDFAVRGERVMTMIRDTHEDNRIG
jgi:hypothetical protein